MVFFRMFLCIPFRKKYIKGSMSIVTDLHLFRCSGFKTISDKMYHCPPLLLRCEVSNKVRFTKLKTKYDINEDISVNYTVKEGVSTSTRDWIGIFPRGWTNLQQYLSFEYAILLPKIKKSSNRTLIFLKAFNKQASFDIDYQFVYVCRKSQILGASPYFRFRPPDSDSSSTNENGVPKPEGSDLLLSSAFTSAGYPPTIVAMDSNNSSKSPIVVLNGASGAMNGSTESQLGKHLSLASDEPPPETCRFCSSPKHSQTFQNRAQFWQLHADNLAGRVLRLERDLALAEAAVKQEQMGQASLMRRLEDYENFIKDMIRNLRVEGTVKIEDKTGEEIVIRKVRPEELAINRYQQSNERTSEDGASAYNCSLNYERSANTEAKKDEKVSEDDKEDPELVSSSVETPVDCKNQCERKPQSH